MSCKSCAVHLHIFHLKEEKLWDFCPEFYSDIRTTLNWKEETSLALRLLCLRVNAHDNEQLGNNVVFGFFGYLARIFPGGAQGPIALLTKCVSRMLGSSLLYCAAFRRTRHHFGGRLLLSD
jgi:hypothetical protein